MEKTKMSTTRGVIDKKKAVAYIIVVVIIAVGVANNAANTIRTYHYEEKLPSNDTKNTRFTITGVEDANITVSFVDEPGLWYRIDITHYTSVKHHAVAAVTKPSFLPLRVHLTSVTRIKTISLVLGTDVAHNIYISGANLNAEVKVDNGAKISGSRCRFHSTGVFKLILGENVNFTSEGMDLVVGDGFLLPEPPERVVLDINLPPGMNGRLSAHNVSFFQNEWPIKYDNEWRTISIDEPLLDIKVFYSLRVWTKLMI